MADKVIEIQQAVKTYGTLKALNNVDISVKRGEIYGLIGDNGAGKTTLLKLITGQIFQTEGYIRIFGTDIPSEIEVQRKRMGAIIENPGFYPNLSIEKNLEYYRILKGVPGKNSVEEVLKLTGLEDKRRKKGKNLSMGMKQRLGLAIALLGEPELLLLDEPMNGLDPSGIIEMRNLLLRLNRDKNITIILSSHILTELEQVATCYGFLSKGMILEEITAEQLKTKCTDFIEIKVSNAKKYSVALEREFKHNDYQVLPDDVIIVNNPTQNIEEFSRLASKNNLDIYRLEKRQTALEDYYMKLKNGGNELC